MDMVTDLMVMDTVSTEVTEATTEREKLRLRLCQKLDTTDTMDMVTDPMVMATGPMEVTEVTTARERLSQFTDMDMDMEDIEVMDITMDIVDMVTEEDTTMVKPKLSFTQYVLSSVLEPCKFQIKLFI